MKIIEASVCAEIISDHFNIPLVDLVDLFVVIPSVDVSHFNFLSD